MAKGSETPTNDEILTSGKVAEMLEVSKRVVEDKLRNGELKGYKKFNKWFILKSDLIAFLTSDNE